MAIEWASNSKQLKTPGFYRIGEKSVGNKN